MAMPRPTPPDDPEAPEEPPATGGAGTGNDHGVPFGPPAPIRAESVSPRAA